MRLFSRLSVAGAVGLALLLGIAGVRLHRARAEPPGWTEHKVEGMRYDVLLPANYDPARHYPVVLYLHQLGMGSWPAGLHKEIDPWFEAETFRAKHPAIVIVPILDQSSDPHGRTINFGGKKTGGGGEQTSIAALKEVMARHATDPTRIYVTGNSMGGMGTWAMLLDYNAYTGTKEHIFAAGMPLAGLDRVVEPAEAAKALRPVPIWAIHGGKDPEVPLDWDRTMAELMRGNPNYRYTEDPKLAHDVWDKYYREDRVWDWLFSQSAPRRPS